MLSFCEICDLKALVEIQLEKEFKMWELFNGQKVYKDCFNHYFELYVKIAKEENLKLAEECVEMHRKINLREAN